MPQGRGLDCRAPGGPADGGTPPPGSPSEVDERHAFVALLRFAKLLLVSPPFRHWLSACAGLARETFGPRAEPLTPSGQAADPTTPAPPPPSRPSPAPCARRSSHLSFSANGGGFLSAHSDVRLRRWKCLAHECAADARYATAVGGLWSAVEYLRNRRIAAKADQHVPTTTSRYAFLQEDICRLVQNFAGGKPLDALVSSCHRLCSTVLDDEVIWAWLERAREYFRSARAADPGEEELAVLLNAGQASFRRRPHEPCHEFEKELRELLHALRRDDDAADRVGRALERLVGEVFFDASGNFVLPPESCDELESLFVPIATEFFSEIPVVSVEEHDDNMDLYIDNIVLDGSQLRPESFTIEATVEDLPKVAAKATGLRRTEIRIASHGSRAHVQNMFFRYNHKSFPRFAESGTADAWVTDKGVSFDIHLEFVSNAEGVIQDFLWDGGESSRRPCLTAGGKGPVTFNAKRVDARVDKLRLDVHDVDHEILVSILMPVVTSRAARQLECSLKSHLEHFLRELDKRATAARETSARVAALIRESGALYQLDRELSAAPRPPSRQEGESRAKDYSSAAGSPALRVPAAFDAVR